MADKSQYPRFITNAPCGEDLFEGKAQEKIANNICNLIRDGKNCNLIGIEGGWGSGKSNLVLQVKKLLNKEGYHFFIYDAWGHQEDLQRRSFLEELTEDLTGSKLINEDWKKRLKRLLAKVRETESKRVPKLSLGVVFIAILILISPVFRSIADKIANHFWNLFVISIPMLLIIVLFLIYIWKEKNGNFGTMVKNGFRKLFLEYQNKVEEETRYEMISEDEPSVRKFRMWMADISKDLQESKLILVFDNMDRLPQKKVQELWASIHVFFCENPYGNIKVLVPFDREHIKLAFQSEDSDKKHYGDDFIDKTFNVIFRISPPILSDWKSYFLAQWNEAFEGPENEENNNNVLQIFDLLMEEVTPRKIIAFINEFVSIKQTVGKSIPNNYVALFILGKQEIVKNPIEEIIKPSFLKSLDYLFLDDDDLPKYLAALFYQVAPEKAIQVVFTDRIKKALNENDAESLENISSIPEFYFILENAITEVSNYENAILALNDLPEERVGNKDQQEIIWECLFKKIEPRNKCKISDFQLILLSKIKRSTLYLGIVLDEFLADPEFSSLSYLDSINVIVERFDDRFDVFSKLKEKETSVADFIPFIEKAKDEYQKYKIIVDQKELENYLIALGIQGLKEVEFIPYLTEDYSFTSFTKKLEELIQTNSPSNNNGDLSVLFKRYKEVSRGKVLKQKLDDSNIFSLFNNTTEEEDFYFDLIAMRIAKLEKFHPSYSAPFTTILKQADESLVKRVSERIEYYINYGELLIGLKALNSPLVKAIARELTLNPPGVSSAVISELIRNFEGICNSGGIEPDALLKRMNSWRTKLSQTVSATNIKEVATPFFLKEAMENDLTICKYCIEKVTEYLNSMDIDQWKESLRNLRSYEIEVSLIINYTVGTNAFEAIKEFLKSIAEGNIPIPEKETLGKIIDRLKVQGKSLKGTFNNVRDTFCLGNIISVELFIFFGDWLFKNADLEKNQASLRTIFTSVARDKECFEIILFHKEKMPAILKSAGEEAQDFKEIIKDKVMNDSSPEIVEFANLLGIQVDVPSEANEDQDS